MKRRESVYKSTGKDHNLISIDAEIEYLKNIQMNTLKIETQPTKDKRVKHGEKEAIQKYWEKNEDKYLTDEYRFNTSKELNRNKIAKQIKEDGNFTSHPDTIKEHAGLDNY